MGKAESFGIPLGKKRKEAVSNDDVLSPKDQAILKRVIEMIDGDPSRVRGAVAKGVSEGGGDDARKSYLWGAFTRGVEVSMKKSGSKPKEIKKEIPEPLPVAEEMITDEMREEAATLVEVERRREADVRYFHKPKPDHLEDPQGRLPL